MRVERTEDIAKMPPAGFEDREDHRTPFASAMPIVAAPNTPESSHHRVRCTARKANTRRIDYKRGGADRQLEINHIPTCQPKKHVSPQSPQRAEPRWGTRVGRDVEHPAPGHPQTNYPALASLERGTRLE